MGALNGTKLSCDSAKASVVDFFIYSSGTISVDRGDAARCFTRRLYPASLLGKRDYPV